MPHSIKDLLRRARDIFRLAGGLLVYQATGNTPSKAHQSMINMFCSTRGYSSDLLSWMFGLVRRPHRFNRGERGVLGQVGDQESQLALAQLNSEGYYVFKQRLPAELCERLLAYALSSPCKMRPTDGDALGSPIKAKYHRDTPQAVRYEFDPIDLLKNDDIQKILADTSFAAIAQEYLGSRPIIDIVALWWHTCFSKQPDAEAAQYFHFDMDRPKWLKYFIYLTDVGPENGPHTFIAKSHRSGGIPSVLLDKGYARLTDEEVERCYDARDFVEFSAPRGTIIAEDTRGLHKGKHVGSGDRLVMQVEFTNCMFGATYSKLYMPDRLTPELSASMASYPDMYSWLAGRT